MPKGAISVDMPHENGSEVEIRTEEEEACNDCEAESGEDS